MNALYGLSKLRLMFSILRQDIVWRGYTVDGEVVESPVDIDALPAGVYRLIAP